MGKGLEESPVCENCNAPLKEPKSRVQGKFSEEDAHILHNPPYEDFG